jgi:hypothetical protein
MAPNLLAGAPMWPKETRGLYGGGKLRHPSGLTDEEWELIEPSLQ